MNENNNNKYLMNIEYIDKVNMNEMNANELDNWKGEWQWIKANYRKVPLVRVTLALQFRVVIQLMFEY